MCPSVWPSKIGWIERVNSLGDLIEFLIVAMRSLRPYSLASAYRPSNRHTECAYYVAGTLRVPSARQNAFDRDLISNEPIEEPRHAGAHHFGLGSLMVTMTPKEKILYHQVNPWKLACDIGSVPVSLYFFWQHDLPWGLVTHFLPAVVGSILVIRYANLEPIKNSHIGDYLRRQMTRAAEGTRLLGDLTTIFGAWFHQPVWIVGGLMLVVLVWCRGFFPETDLELAANALLPPVDFSTLVNSPDKCQSGCTNSSTPAKHGRCWFFSMRQKP